jgi:hypothetical protein
MGREFQSTDDMAGRIKISQVLPQSFEERVPHLSLGGFRPVLDLGQ